MSLAATPIEHAFNAAFAAASALRPLTVTLPGGIVSCVQLEPWTSASELMDGYRTGAETCRVSVRSLDVSPPPKVRDKFEIGERRGTVDAVEDGGSYYLLTLTAYK